MNIKNIFKEIQEYHNESYFIDELDIDNSDFHFGILKPKKLDIFTEYIFGNYDDTKIIINYYKNNIIKSYFCSLCSIDESTNYNTYCKDKLIIPKNNPARDIKYKLVLNNIRYILSGTVPQYYTNHLLLTTEEHISSYIILLNYDYFKSVINFIKDQSNNDMNIKGIFNGTYGSDVWHLHIHITNQYISILDKVKKYINKHILDTDIYTTIYNKNSGIKLQLIASTSKKKLFDIVKNLASNILILNRDRYYISCIFLYHKNYHCVCMIFGQKYNDTTDFRRIAIDNNKIFDIIYPAFLVLSNTKNNNLSDLSQVILKMKTYDIFLTDIFDNYNSNNYNNIIDNYNVDIQNVHSTSYIELLQILYLDNNSKLIDNCNDVFKNNNINLLLNNVILNDNYKCSKNKYTCNNIIKSVYKYLITIITICYFKNIDITKNNFQLFLKQNNYLEQAINSELYKLQMIYKITNLNSLYIKGDLAIQIITDIFNNLLYITNINKKIINIWLNHDSKNKLNEGSFGTIYKDLIDDKIFIALKMNKSNLLEHKLSFIHEYNVGYELNKFISNIPNFSYTFGNINCIGNNDNSICMKNNNIQHDFIITGLINNSVTLYNYLLIINNASVDILFKEQSILQLLQQIMFSLAYVNHNCKFTHYDLHVSNILITPHNNDNLEYINYIYKINDMEYQIETTVNISIIDYGSAHIDNVILPKNNILRSYFKSLGFRSNEYAPYCDIYILFITLIKTIYSVYSNNDIIQMKLLNTVFNKFIHSYTDIFNDPDTVLNNQFDITKLTNINFNIHKNPTTLPFNYRYKGFIEFSEPLETGKYLNKFINIIGSSNITKKWGFIFDNNCDIINTTSEIELYKFKKYGHSLKDMTF